ncbi:MAG TPA: glyoxylate/hydroxypyruvate reductase A [Geminicoccaceae bacterium]
MALLFISPDDPAELWRDELTRRMPELDVRIWPETGPPEDVEVALVWRPPAGALRALPNLKAILSLGAGIDGLIADPTLPDVPVAKMVDPSLTRTMSEYVLATVLRHHRGLDRFERAQRERRWDYAFPPQASERRVGIMGQGELGSDAARVLRAHGFQVAGWSRTPKEIEGVDSFAGDDGLGPFLARTDILVCLLPLTASTRGILGRATFERLPDHAYVINAARGAHLVDDELIAALDGGRLAGATLDVFHEEPLPGTSPLWAHPKVLITPHVASYCVPSSAAEGVIDNVRRALAGRPLDHQVDRSRGY